MTKLKPGLTLMLMFVIPALVISGHAQAQEPKVGELQGNALADGKLTKEELAAAMLIAEKDLNGMLEEATESVESELEQSGVFSPGAWMILKNRDLKSVKLSQEAVGAPPSAKLQMYRASLRSLARHDQIDSALIAYPATIKREGMAESEPVVAIEHEHRLGVSGLKLIPVKLEQSGVQFGTPIDQDKKFQVFYDQRE